MATVINNPDTGSGSGAGWLVGLVLAIVIIALFFLYGLPAIRGNNNSGTNVNVPEKVQIDVNTPSN